MNHYYLWNGIGAIEDLDDCDGDIEKACQELAAKTSGCWTLWRREGYSAKLVAIHLPEQRDIRTGRLGHEGGGVYEEFVYDD